MGTIADKLLYLDGTKTALRDAINQAGGYLTTADPFRDYVDDWLRSQSATLSLEFWCERFLTRRRGGMAENALGFANIITFTRASSGGVFNAYGQYVSLATNVWRPDHDPASVTTSTSTVAFDSLTATFTLSSGHAFQVGDKFRATAVAGSLWGVVVARTDTTATVHVRNSTTTGSASSWTCIKPRGILIEEQRTNLLTYSAVFSGASWIKAGSVVAANVALSPSGLTDAALLREDTSTGVHLLTKNFSTTATAYASSLFVKAAGRTKFRIANSTGNLPSAEFDLTALTATNLGTSTGAEISPVGNGWYRCTVSRTVSAASEGFVVQLMSGASTTYTGDGTSGIYIWGAQLEAGAFPTSYIPTEASQVTRSADVASVNTLSPWYNASEGSFVVAVSKVAMSGTAMALDMRDAVNRQGVVIASVITPTDRTVDIASRADDSSNFIQVGNYTPGSTFKVAMAFINGSMSGCVNGGAVSSAVRSVGQHAGQALWLGRVTPGANYWNGHIESIQYYPRRLSNTELQEITA